MPAFWLDMGQIATNRFLSSRWVPSIIVPAVTLNWHEGLVRGPPPVGQAAEPVSGVVCAAHDADLEAGDAPGMDGSAVPVGSPRHLGRAPGPVSGERLVEVGAVDLPGDRRPCPEGQKLPMTSQSLMRMNQEVRRHTWQSLAHSLRLRPENV